MSVTVRCLNPAIFGNGYDGFIYFIQVENTGPIKIGYATDYLRRFKALQHYNPYKLKLLYATPGCLSDEQLIHNQLKKRHKDLHLKGEWYHPGKVIFETIEDFRIWDERDSEYRNVSETLPLRGLTHE